MGTNNIGRFIASLGRYDILIFADVARKSDTGLRIRREIECYSEMGYRVGIRHVPGKRSKGAASPDLDYCISRGLAEIVPTDASVKAKVVLVFSPAKIDRRDAGFENLQAKRVMLIVDSIPKPGQLSSWRYHETGIAEITIAPTNRWVRAALMKSSVPLQVEREDWRSYGCAAKFVEKPEMPNRALVVGRFSTSGKAQWPKKRTLFEAYGFQNSVEFLYVGAPPSRHRSAIAKLSNWLQIEFETVSVVRFVEMLDAFAYFPSARMPELPEAAISAAMASGKPVFLPPRFRPHFGPGAIYCSVDRLKAEIRSVFADPVALETVRKEAVQQAGFQFPKKALCDRMLELAGPPPKRRRAAQLSQPTKPRALFVPSNGVGLGHVTRLLAIARRMDERFQPVFASMAQATSLIEATGYTAEYIPSQSDTGEAPAKWDRWFGLQLQDLIDRYQVSLVVFDGNHPNDGLVRAVGSRPGCKLVWVRRGMLGDMVSPYLENVRFVDLIIEPGEVARERETGLMVSRRAEAMEVPPITLLDRAEALSRKAAREELGLDPERPAVLVQLGAGFNRDALGLIDKVVTELRKSQTLQIVVAEWENGLVGMPVWPGTKVLRGFPISRFFNAFDFSISAAGYNTFHEVMMFGLPTIFLANRHPQLDDQWTRAEFAQDNQAGFNLPEDEIFQLPTLCEALTNKPIQDVIRRNCRRLIGENGAAVAATAVTQLVRDS